MHVFFDEVNIFFFLRKNISLLHFYNYIIKTKRLKFINVALFIQ